MNQALLLVLHVLATVIWVGGMFFAHQVLRPVAAARLEPPARLALWNDLFARFFPWVWGAVILLPLTGFALLFTSWADMGDVPGYVRVMTGLGVVMIGLFVVLYAAPYQRLRHAVAAGEWEGAARQLLLIRRFMVTNLSLGLITVVVATGGSYF